MITKINRLIKYRTLVDKNDHLVETSYKRLVELEMNYWKGAAVSGLLVLLFCLALAAHYPN